MRRPFELGSQFYQRMQDAKAAKREQAAQQQPVAPEKRPFVPVRKPAPAPEVKGVLTTVVPPEPKPAA